jgi:hypothetical protein
MHRADDPSGDDDLLHDLPDVRDGLTRLQRIVLYELWRAQRETGREFIPTVMLYGRVVEHVSITELELQVVLQSLGVAGDARNR